MSARRSMARVLLGLLLVAAVVAAVRWDGGYPTAPITGIAVSSSDSTPLKDVQVGSWVVGEPVARYSAVTDTQGHFLVRIPVLKRVVVEVGGECHDAVSDTVRALAFPRHLHRIPLVRRPGGRPAEHVVCPSSAAEDRANRPMLAAALSSKGVQDWVAEWAPSPPVSLATTELEWGSVLAAGRRSFTVVRPAVFGVELPADGSSLLNLYVSRKPDGRACLLLEGFPADKGKRPEDLVVHASPTGSSWRLEESGDWPGCR